MALGTGSIRFSQIVSEFGGVSPHRFSEYKALSGLGVSGIPASGAMRFSQFRGKSNQVTTSVWIESGYNSSSWVNRYNNSNRDNKFNWRGYYWVIINRTTGYGRSGDWGASSGYTYGNFRYTVGAHVSTYGNNNWRDHKLVIDELVTTWVDTSSYQNQTTTAQITT